MSLYFEDFAVGQAHRSSRPRSVSAKTIEAFAELSGDKNRLHLDEAYAAATPFGQRIAHGLLGLSIASGLLHELGIVQESILAFAGLEWRFKGPVRIGDELSFEATVAKLKSMGAKGGVVVLAARLTTQDGRTVQEGTWTLMIRRRPA